MIQLDDFRCEVAFGVPPASYEAIILACSPRGYWRHKEGAELEDSSGFGNTLVKTGTIAEIDSLLPVEAGSDDKAGDFDGSSGFYTAADSASLDLGDTFTLEAHGRVDAFPGATLNARIFDKGTAAFGLRVNSDGTFSVIKVGSVVISTSTQALTLGQRHHIAATKDGADVHLYLDGVDVTGALTPATCEDNATDLAIGRNPISNDSFFNGALDEMAVFASALSAELIAIRAAAADPQWTNVSSRLQGLLVAQGKQKELDQTDAGTGTFRFDNSDRALDPEHAGSPYAGKVRAMTPIRLSIEYDGDTHEWFRGYVQAWPQAGIGPNVGVSEITAVDAFFPFSLADVGEGQAWPREKTGARINRVLDLAGFPSGQRAIDEGYSEVAEVTFELGSGVTALDHIMQVAGAELGLFFIDGRGRATFHDRHHRKSSANLASQAIFGDANTPGFTYRDVVLDTDEGRIWNDVQVTTPGGVTQRAEDPLSQIWYLRRTMARQTPLARATEAEDQADYLKETYKSERARLDGIEIIAHTPALMEQALSREISDHITVNRWPQKVGLPISQEAYIEHRELSFDGGVPIAKWILSTPAFTAVDWWLLGDAVFGELGTTTRIIY